MCRNISFPSIPKNFKVLYSIQLMGPQMLIKPLRKESVSDKAGIASDPGLGLLDALFASLSMIIVSEVIISSVAHSLL